MSLGKTLVEKGTTEVIKAVGREVGDQVSDKFISKPIGGLIENLGDAVTSSRKGVRRGIYDRLVNPVYSTPEKQEEAFLTKKRGDYKRGLITRPVLNEETGKVRGDFKKQSDNPLMSWMYDNPNAAADIGSIGIPLAGAGLATYFARKPKSDYALGLGASTGNSNIDAARASAYYQQQTAQMKFDHQMQLQQARQQAQTPGRQAYGNALGLGLPDQLGGSPRDAYNMAASIVGAQSPIYK